MRREKENNKREREETNMRQVRLLLLRETPSQEVSDSQMLGVASRKNCASSSAKEAAMCATQAEEEVRV